MLGGQNYRGTRYSRYTIEGQDNPDWRGPTVDRLMDFLNDSSVQPEDKKLAAEILPFCAERKKINPDIADFWNDIDATALWEWPDQFQLRDVTTEGGAIRKGVFSVPQEFILPPIAHPKSAAA